nr:MAG TPA: hypothetical protein [Caudoviricetes sp.]
MPLINVLIQTIFSLYNIANLVHAYNASAKYCYINRFILYFIYFNYVYIGFRNFCSLNFCSWNCNSIYTYLMQYLPHMM